MRDLSAETMDLKNRRSERRELKITDVQTTMVDGNYICLHVRNFIDVGVIGTGEIYWGGGGTDITERMKILYSVRTP